MTVERPLLERLGALLGILVLARMAFLVFMPATYAFDVHAWLNVLQVVREGGDPYVLTRQLHYLPLWPALLRSIAYVADATGISVVHGLQFFLIAVDALNLVLVHRLLAKSSASPTSRRALLLGLALNPISILLTMQHGNFDALVATWLLLFIGALWSYQRSGSRRSWLFACFFLGMGVVTKTVPLILTPLLLLGPWRKDLGVALAGTMLFVAPAFISLLPWTTTDPLSVIHRVLDYRSLSGWFGITGLLDLAGLARLSNLYVRAGALIMLVLMAWATRRVIARTLLDECLALRLVLALLIGIVLLGPGYSPQYIGWYLPLLVLLFVRGDNADRRVLRLIYSIGALTYFFEYALIPSHGAFLLHWTSGPAIADLSHRLSMPGAQTLLRIPLFLAYVALLITITRPLVRNEGAVQVAR